MEEEGQPVESRGQGWMRAEERVWSVEGQGRERMAAERLGPASGRPEDGTG